MNAAVCFWTLPKCCRTPWHLVKYPVSLSTDPRFFLAINVKLSDCLGQTWIVIILIIISIIVTMSEVVLRFGILSRTTPVKGAPAPGGGGL